MFYAIRKKLTHTVNSLFIIVIFYFFSSNDDFSSFQLLFFSNDDLSHSLSFFAINLVSSKIMRYLIH
jgi:hypothetical protein